MSTYSTNLKIELIGDGEQSGTWGSTTNGNLGTVLEQAIVGKATVNFPTDASITITMGNGPATSDTRCLLLSLTSTGSLTATRTLTVPSIQKTYMVYNGTTGSQSITVSSGAGTTVTIPNGKRVLIYVDTTTGVYQQFSDLVSGTTLNNLALATTTDIMGRNRIINGNFFTAQRATSATVTAGTAVPTASTGYPCCDRWFVYSTGANVTAAQTTGIGPAPSAQFGLQVTGAASVTAIGIGQRIEVLNSYDMAGQTCTLSAFLSNSLLTTVTWTASYANSSYVFGTIGTPTKTQIATGTFTVTSSLAQYSASFSVPAAAKNGVEILFTVGAQTSGTFVVSNVQYETGSVATPFERLSYSTQLAQCQRYYSQLTVPSFRGYNVSASNVLSSQLRNLQTMLASPTGAIVTQPTSTSNITGNVSVGETNPDYFTVSFTGTAAGQSFYSATVVSLAAEVS
jgi:hypothetical protein